MARGRRLAEWDRTAALLAMMFNNHRDPKKADPADGCTFHPYRRKPERKAEPLMRMTLREAHKLIFKERPMPTGKS